MPSPRVAAVAVMGLLTFGVLSARRSPTRSPRAPQSRRSSWIWGARRRRAPRPKPQRAHHGASSHCLPEPPLPPPQPRLAPALKRSQRSAKKAKMRSHHSRQETLGAGGNSDRTITATRHSRFSDRARQSGLRRNLGPASPVPYLANTLRAQGELLSNYYAVAGGELANEVALISGQGPTPQTAADCPVYSEIAPASVSSESQVTGAGCVYPATTMTLPGQLATAGKSWKAYIEAIGNGGANQADRQLSPPGPRSLRRRPGSVTRRCL